jgi:hypothetical protein
MPWTRLVFRICHWLDPPESLSNLAASRATRATVAVSSWRVSSDSKETQGRELGPHFLRPLGFRFRLRRAVCLSPLRASMPATPRERFTGTGLCSSAHAFTSPARQTGVARSLASGSGKSGRRAHRFACVREVFNIAATSASPTRSSGFWPMYKILTQDKWGGTARTARPVAPGLTGRKPSEPTHASALDRRRFGSWPRTPWS